MHSYEEILQTAAADPLVFGDMMRAVLDGDASTKLWAIDVVEKVTERRPLFLTPHRHTLITELATMSQPEIRSRVAQMYSRFFWDEWELKQVVNFLGNWIDNESDEDVIANAMLSLYILSTQKQWIAVELLPRLKAAEKSDNPLIRELAEKLLAANNLAETDESSK